MASWEMIFEREFLRSAFISAGVIRPAALACDSRMLMLPPRPISSALGIVVGSKFSALMRFISEIMLPAPFLFLSSRAAASAAVRLAALSTGLSPRGSCEADVVMANASASPPSLRGTALKRDSSSSWPSTRPSTSEAIWPRSISWAILSASARFSAGISLLSSFVVYNSSLKVEETPYIFSLAANWSQAPVPFEPSSNRPVVARVPFAGEAAPPSFHGTNSRPPLSPPCREDAICESVAKPLPPPLLGLDASMLPEGGGTSSAVTCRKSFPGMMSVSMTSPLKAPDSVGSRRTCFNVIDWSPSMEQP
mmetsp:Transcript_86437/g.241965  ORF Transcript_86437/g.241965 Transcript_86437/m.241965 type:complete len:308 (-) Transcript_86437:306-1229(-)